MSFFGKMRKKGVTKFFCKPKKGFRTYGSQKGWRCMKPCGRAAAVSKCSTSEVIPEGQQWPGFKDPMYALDSRFLGEIQLQVMDCNEHLQITESNADLTEDQFTGFDSESISYSKLLAFNMRRLCDEISGTLADGALNLHIPSTQKPISSKPVIRVLSLFDGISTGYYVLSQKLGFDVEVYYSSEIDKDALLVQRKHFHLKIVPLGCVKSIGFDTIQSLGPIHLLLGASPCEELSRVNPRRKGLYDTEGTGHLFFYYVSLKMFLEKENMRSNTPFFWLFENSANLNKQCQLDMSMYLGCSPEILCSSLVSPMKRKRYFWGNIPDLHQSADIASLSRSSSLQDYLDPLREASVAILPTITTNSCSQRTGKDKVFPVTGEDGAKCQLTINELERIFGFPTSFTDAGSLSVTRRGKLIGKSWSVPVLTHILKPLVHLFKTKFQLPSNSHESTHSECV